MSSSALQSQGMVIQISDAASPEVYTTIAEVMSIDGPGGSAAVIDVTDLSSTAKEKRAGLQDEGQVSFDMNYLPTNTQHILLRPQRAGALVTNFRILFTDSPQTTWSFSALVLGFSISNAGDDVTKAAVTLEVTGAVVAS